MSTLIQLVSEKPVDERTEIIQLYAELELLRLGDPPRHSLFILGRDENPPSDAPPSDAPPSDATDRILIVDPPRDLESRFRVTGDVALLPTRADNEATRYHTAPRLATKPGGIAHIRMGRHFLDIYSQTHYTALHFPALGLVYAGEFGSNSSLPRLAAGDDGSDAVESVRIVAALVKGRSIRLFIPHVGSLGTEVVPVMERLAADVAYLHQLRRIASGLTSIDSDEDLAALAATLLPTGRKSDHNQAVNLANLRTAYAAQAV